MPNTKPEAVTLPFRDWAAFEKWLEKNHHLQPGVWLKLAKKSSGIESLTADEAVDLGLCFGWISGQRLAHDDTHYLQKYVPRRARSLWSQVNVAKVEKLMAQGKIRPSGLAEIDAARADGRWAVAYESQRNATVPPDLVAALKANKHAKQAFDALGKTQRYAVIMRLITARSPKARAAQLQKAMTTLGEDESA